MTPSSNGRRPAAVAAERAVLGAVLLDPEAFAATVDLLDADDFADRELGAIYRACAAAFDAGETVTLPLIATRTGLDELLHDLVAETASAASVALHAGLVHETACRRRAVAIGSDLARNAADGDLGDLVDSTVSALLDLTRDAGDGDLAPLSAVIRDTFAEVERAYRDKAPRMGLTTGFPALDSVLGGLRPGQLVIVGARPSVGKTALACSMATAAATAGPVLFASAEMSKEELGFRFTASDSGLDLRRLTQGRLSPDEWRVLTDASARVAELPITILDRALIRPATIRAACQRMRPKPALVIVDYLQLLDAGDKHETRNNAVGQVTRELKVLARDAGAPVLLLSQLNRNGNSRPDPEPFLSDLRDSGEIEQHADVVLFIWRDNQEQHRLKIGKQRNGALAKFAATFNAPTATFTDLELLS